MPKWVGVLFGIVLIFILLPFFMVFGGAPLFSSDNWLLYFALGFGVWAACEEIKKYNDKKKADLLFKKCPACAETIKFEAKICRFCGTSLQNS